MSRSASSCPPFRISLDPLARLRRAAWTVAVAAGSVLPSSAIQAPDDPSLPTDFDRRAELRGVVRERGQELARAEVAAAYRERFGDRVELHWGDLGDRPSLALVRGAALAELEVDSEDPDVSAALREFVRANRELFGLLDDEVRQLRVDKSYSTRGTGLRHVSFTQMHGGIPVYEGGLRFTVDAAGRLLNVVGEHFTDLSSVGDPLVGADEALEVAARGIGIDSEMPPPIAVADGVTRATSFGHAEGFRDTPRASLVLLPIAPGEARLAWDVRLQESISGWDNLYQVLVDGETGDPIVRRRLTLFVDDPANARGEVFEIDPSYGPQLDESFAGDPIASPLNWVEANQTFTTGNNIASRADRAGDNNPDNPMANGRNSLQFDFTFRDRYATNGQVADQDAAITQGFYMGNLYHDHFYALGFDEAAGNYQVDNFGNGGLGGDLINVDVQDSANNFFPRNNANFSPSVDGVPGRTQYFLFTEPNRDSSFDNEVYWHEFSHGLSTRLVGGPGSICLGGAQGGGMGEGWGDFLAISFFADASDDPAGPQPLGDYVTGDTEKGIRRYPYASDMALNPLTYADLCDNGSCQVHAEGEIWATTLWDARRDLIVAHGFEEGRLRIEQLVVDGLKMSPCNPNFLSMRDLILQSSDQRYGDADTCILRKAFARRGMGVDAVSSGTGSNASAGFEVTPALAGLVAFSPDKETLSWPAEANAVGYPVGRGTFGVGSPTSTFDNAACQESSADTTHVDAARPAAGGGFYYVVGVDDGCDASGFGTATDGTPREVAPCQ